MTTSPLSPRGKAILCWLWKHPSDGVQKLADAVGLRSRSNVCWHLERLNHQGYIKPGPGRTNCTRILTGTGLLAAQGYQVLWWESQNGGK